MIKKLFKWGIAFLRTVFLKLKYGNKLTFDYSSNGKPVYFGRNVSVSMEKGCSLRIGGGTYISDNTKIIVMDSASVIIGTHNYFGSGCRILIRNRLIIGDDNLFAENVSIYDHNHDYINEYVGYTSDSIVINNKCWLATNVVVTAGAKIGEGVVAGANSVVGGVLEPYGLYVMPRAKRLKEIKVAAHS